MMFLLQMKSVMKNISSYLLSNDTGWSKYQHSLERRMKLFRFYCIMSVDSLFVEQLMRLGLVDSLNW